MYSTYCKWLLSNFLFFGQNFSKSPLFTPLAASGCWTKNSFPQSLFFRSIVVTYVVEVNFPLYFVTGTQPQNVFFEIFSKSQELHSLQVAIRTLKSRKQRSSECNSQMGLQVCSLTRHCLLCWTNCIHPPLAARGYCYVLHLLQVAIATLKSRKQRSSEKTNRMGLQLCSLTRHCLGSWPKKDNSTCCKWHFFTKVLHAPFVASGYSHLRKSGAKNRIQRYAVVGHNQRSVETKTTQT